MRVLILKTGQTEEVAPIWAERLIEQGRALIAPEASAPAAEEAAMPDEEARTAGNTSEEENAEKTPSEAEKTASRKPGKKR